MDDVRAVPDAAESRQTVVFGFSEGGLMSVLFSASYPERIALHVLWGASPRGSGAPDYPWGRSRKTASKTSQSRAKLGRARNGP